MTCMQEWDAQTYDLHEIKWDALTKTCTAGILCRMPDGFGISLSIYIYIIKIE